MDAQMSPRRVAAIELVRRQVRRRPEWLEFWGVPDTRWSQHPALHAVVSWLPLATALAAAIAEAVTLAIVAGVSLMVSIFAMDARSAHRRLSERINWMLNSVPGLEEQVLAGAEVDADVLFQFRLGGPPRELSAADIRAFLTSLGDEGLDLAAQAAASGWADGHAARAVERMLSVPEFAQWWETLFAAPGWDRYLAELAARRVNEDTGRCTVATAASDPEIFEAVLRSKLDEVCARMPLATKVALACGVALDPVWFPEMYSAAEADPASANVSLQGLSSRARRRLVKRLVEQASSGETVVASAANRLLDVELSGSSDVSAADLDLAVRVLLEGDRSPETARLLDRPQESS